MKIFTARPVGASPMLNRGSAGILGAGSPQILAAAATGEAYEVTSVMAWGAHWWQVVSGPMTGAGIPYHDPSWDVR